MEKPSQERDRLPARRLATITVGVTLVGAVAVAVSGALGHTGASTAAPAAPRAQIGIVEQTLIAATERGVELRRAQEADLRKFGWVDEAHAIARIPIDRAMAIVVERSR